VENQMNNSKVVGALQWRYAVKKFDSTKVLSPAQLSTVLDALCLTPTSMGLQLMQFLVIENREMRKKIREKSYNQSQVEESSHLLILCRKDVVTKEDIELYIDEMGRIRNIDTTAPAIDGYRKMLYGALTMEPQNQAAWMDNQVYIALGNLLTACAVEKIDACPMEGFDRDAIDEILELKGKGLRSVVMCPVGFRADDDKYAALKKVRRPNAALIQYI
jgi:nitroreductase / dihydropteridine reductase